MTETDEIRETAQFYFDLLIKLLEESHPQGGEDTKFFKLEMARNALELSWRLRDCIAVWAQAQLVGYCICRDDQEMLDFLSHKIGQNVDENSHILEALGMQFSGNHTERTDEAFPEMSDWLEEWQVESGQEGIFGPETMRSIINEMMMSRTVNSSFWRMDLQHALMALNTGEVQDLVAPTRGKKQGRPYPLTHNKACAIMHVRFRVGKGMKKYRALEDVASALAVSPETLRTWEKELNSNEDHSNNFYCAELAGLFEERIRKSQFSGSMKLDRLEYGRHRVVWNIDAAFHLYKNELSIPLEDIRKSLNSYRRK